MLIASHWHVTARAASLLCFQVLYDTQLIRSFVCPQIQDPLAFLQLQRELGAAQGTWLTRARAATGSVASAFDAAEVR